jgi:D-alanyl-lipoteichoic acid acyltransferase DltB (MBOAT superfamily)
VEFDQLSFVSAEFPIFMATVFTLYYLSPSIAVQNLVILVASYVFYGFWDWRFIPLLFGISIANYIAAILIAQTSSSAGKRLYLWAAISISLAALAFFKYFNFFVSSAASGASLLGLQMSLPTAQILLPLGISFMTFQGIAYVVDVWRGEHAAERDLIRFLAFKAFFPQLVAGPIERASHLLDQFSRPRTLDLEKVRRAAWLLAYGYCLKIVFADSMAAIVDSLFVKNQPFAWSVVFGTIAFGIQIYADFCGYSLIAKGAALLFGFDLIWNFRFPYWAVSISDFWRRWHISLSNWLRDYLYIPLGGSRHGSFVTARNLLITMGLGGLWHGASWNFVFWGLLHGAALALRRFLPVSTVPVGLVGKIIGWLVTMAVVFTGWFLFRANSWDLMSGMASAFSNWEWAPVHAALTTAIVAVVLPLALLEWLLQKKGDYFLVDAPIWIACPAYAVLVILSLAMASHYQASFIYFQF